MVVEEVGVVVALRLVPLSLGLVQWAMKFRLRPAVALALVQRSWIELLSLALLSLAPAWAKRPLLGLVAFSSLPSSLLMVANATVQVLAGEAVRQC